MKEPLELTLRERDWDVEGEPDGQLLIATSMFNRYSAEMRAVTRAVERLPGYDPEAYYAIVTRIPNTLGYEGYMPLRSQFAFIFVPR